MWIQFSKEKWTIVINTPVKIAEPNGLSEKTRVRCQTPEKLSLGNPMKRF
jgi:hypothetical protein